MAADQVKKIHEEEWSFIPVGGPLPVAQQPITAFGAAANLVHPATGYSIARSLREAPAFAQEVASLLRKQQAVGDTAESVWDALWPQEKRRQVLASNCITSSSHGAEYITSPEAFLSKSIAGTSSNTRTSHTGLQLPLESFPARSECICSCKLTV